MPHPGPGSGRKKLRQVRKGPSPANNARAWTTAPSASRTGVSTHDAVLTSSRNSRPPIATPAPAVAKSRSTAGCRRRRRSTNVVSRSRTAEHRSDHPGADGVHGAPAYAGSPWTPPGLHRVSEPERLAHRSLRVSLALRGRDPRARRVAHGRSPTDGVEPASLLGLVGRGSRGDLGRAPGATGRRGVRRAGLASRRRRVDRPHARRAPRRCSRCGRCSASRSADGRPEATSCSVRRRLDLEPLEHEERGGSSSRSIRTMTPVRLIDPDLRHHRGTAEPARLHHQRAPATHVLAAGHAALDPRERQVAPRLDGGGEPSDAGDVRGAVVEDPRSAAPVVDANGRLPDGVGRAPQRWLGAQQEE